jgi:hypothetical protein
MMKYVINHPSQMKSTHKPFALGFLLYTVTLYTEILTVIYISTVYVTIDVIIKQVCLASIAKVSIFYA